VRRVIPVQNGLDAVQGNGLEEQPVVGLALDLERDVVPAVVHRVAGGAGRNPLRVGVVPDVPLVASSDTALVSPDQRETIEVHADIELQDLYQRKLSSVEVRIISEVMKRRTFVRSEGWSTKHRNKEWSRRCEIQTNFRSEMVT